MNKLYLCCLLILTACSENKEVQQTLQYASENIQEYPDSVLCRLEKLDPNAISRKKDKARYALLYSQALDKNYIDVDKDSLIRPAVKYFERHGNNQQKYLSLYYLGRVQHNARDYNSAIISFTQAKEYAEKQGDHYFLGLISSQIGDIHSIYYNYPSGIDAYNDAYKHYIQTPHKEHSQYALLNLAFAYAAAKQYDESLDVLSKMLDDPEIVADTLFLTVCLGQKASIYYSRRQISQAKDVILSIPNQQNAPLTLSDYLIMAHVYTIENKPDSTELCLNAAKACAVTVNEKASITLTEAEINKCTKNYFKAYENIEQCMYIQDSIARLTLNQSVTSAQRDYYERQSAFATDRLRTNKHCLILIVLIAVLVIAGLTLYFLHIRKMKDMEIAEYMAMTYRIQNTLQTVKKETNQQQRQMSDLIKRLFNDQFELIDRLGITYYERQNTKSERDAIFDEVKLEVKKLGSDKQTKQQLEQIVNACKDNIIQKFREQIPQVTEEDCALLCYLIAGFSYRAISIFSQSKVDNIYARKSRLKTKIANSDAPDKAIFESMI